MKTKTEIKPPNAAELDDLDQVAQAELAKYLDEPLDALALGIKASCTEIAQSKGRIAAVSDHVRESAISAGFMFLAAKSRLGHGTLGKFIEASDVSWDTANLYMGLAANYERARNLPPGTSLRSAYALLGIKKPRGDEKDPAKQLRQEIERFGGKLRDLSKKVPPTERPALAEAVLSVKKQCQKVAVKFSVEPRSRAQPLPKIRLPLGSELLPPEVREAQADLLLAVFIRS